VVTPAAGESVTEGTILEWRVAVGDSIKVDDTIVEISTDKVDIELPSPATGTVTEILIEEGDTVTVGQVIARIAVGDAAGDGAIAAQSAAETAGPTDAAPEEAQEPVTAAADGAAAAAAAGGASTAAAPDGKRVSPVAARAAAVEGVALDAIE